MDKKALISEYFQKAAALVLSAAGVESIDKQALYLIAAETEKYASDLSAHAAKFAEAARRTKCTVDDIDAAAQCINDMLDISHFLPVARNRIALSPESKKRLRTSIENKIVHDTVSVAHVDSRHYSFPQFSDGTGHHSTESPLKSFQKRMHCYPEWLQKELEPNGATTKKEMKIEVPETEKGDETEQTHIAAQHVTPLSMVSALVLAEEESREILTKKLALNTNGVSRTHN